MQGTSIIVKNTFSQFKVMAHLPQKTEVRLILE